MEKPAYGGFWLRFVAAFIDGLILFVPQYFITVAAGPGTATNGLTLVISWLYFALMESSAWQGTLGKKALGLRVTDTDGNRIGFGRATGRYFGKIVSAIILFVGYIMAAFTAKKQALHDIMASTLVVRGAAATTTGGVSA